MKAKKHLKEILKRIDGKGYKAYKSIKNEYAFQNFTVAVKHVQGDPYSAPTRVYVRVERKLSGFADDTTSNKIRTIALCDFLTRRFFKMCKKYSRGNRGIGKSGLITIDQPVQEIHERNSMVVNSRVVEARLFMGLPAFGRTISAKHADIMFFEELPKIVEASLFINNLNREKLYNHIQTTEDADFLRDNLDRLNLVGFIADNSLLPRASGIDPKPLETSKTIPFKSPEKYSIKINLPNKGTISGMGIPKGITLIVGGGYHGKSTLLNTLELGIYNHVPGDGREYAVTDKNAVKIRSAGGRSIVNTDISPFISNLPMGKDTVSFSTENASGSTSQAAAISESVEMKASVLLLDEDTSATNFMIRDHRMQQLVSKRNEPITPFVDKVRYLYKDYNISTVLVMGGSGDYFPVADHVIQMTSYIPMDVTQEAKHITQTHISNRENEGGLAFGTIHHRIPIAKSFSPHRNNKVKISTHGNHEIIFGNTTIHISDIEQITDPSQTRAIGYAIWYATKYMDSNRTLHDIINLVQKDIDQESLDILTPYCTGDLARFRPVELAAAINRMRSVNIRQLII